MRKDTIKTPAFLDTLSRIDVWLAAMEAVDVDDEENAEEVALELELYEGNLYSVIFEYCIEQGYTFMGFPQRYLEDSDAADDAIEDEITYERMVYYIWKTALEQADVFMIMKKVELWANPDVNDATIKVSLKTGLQELGDPSELFEQEETDNE